MITVPDFKSFKEEGKKLSMITCYDNWSAKILNDSNVDCILVGDSSSMVVHGEASTVNSRIEHVAHYTQSVARGATQKFIVADLPFLSYRGSLNRSIENVQLLFQAGAHAVKLEGAVGNLELIRHLTDSGVPVMGHLGLTPQFVNQFGGFKVQGRGESASESIKKDALDLQEAGCFCIVLECIPTSLATAVTKSLNIPTIGIGAGPDCDGQVLVMQDMLGMNKSFQPKFVRKYLEGFELFKTAFNQFDESVKSGTYPQVEESYEK